tara:strand:+ start:135 stop:338 length:204 start_codon:yes stop_codon:yes gene_type:complete
LLFPPPRRWSVFIVNVNNKNMMNAVMILKLGAIVTVPDGKTSFFSYAFSRYFCWICATQHHKNINYK